MKERYIAIALALLCKCVLWAQEVKVQSFELDQTDLTAQHENVKDSNGDMCALIKVQIMDDKVKFEGDVIKQAETSPNEYHVFVIDGTQRLKLSASNAMPVEVEFSKYGIDEVKGGLTYVLKMKMPEQAPGVVFEVGMPNVAITVDGKKYTTDAMGGLDLPLANGHHTFTVNKEGYYTYEGVIDIDKIPVIKTIEMKRGDGLLNMGLLAITYPLNSSFTIVPLNASAVKPKKNTVITGQQIPLNGEYMIKFNKKKYQPLNYPISVKPGDNIKLALSNVALDADARLMANDYAKAFKEYKKLADKGDDLAQYKLGNFYLDGKGTAANLDMAIVCWNHAAKQGNMNAFQKLYEYSRTYSDKLQWLSKMAENGNGDAMLLLSRVYRKQNDRKQMMQWLQKACNAGNYQALYDMGEMYYYGDGYKQIYSRAYKYFNVAAAHGNMQAKEKIADYQYLGLEGSAQNKKAAVETYQKLGDKLSDDGIYRIGQYYYEEYEKSGDTLFLKLADEAFRRLNPDAANVHWTANAYDIFYRLAEEQKEEAAAIFYYRLCERTGCKDAKVYNALGRAYRLGYGVNSDNAKAYLYYKKSSDMGDKEGFCFLGLCYEFGLGVNKDQAEAAKLYQHAIDLGSATAAGYLGTLYYTGVAGLPKDTKKAVEMWTKAANANHISSVKNLIRYYKAKKNNKKLQYWNKKLKDILSEKQ